MHRWMISSVALAPIVLGFAVPASAGTVEGHFSHGPRTTIVQPVTMQPATFEANSATVRPVKADAQVQELYAASRFATPADMLFEVEPQARSASQAPHASGLLTGLDLPEPGPVSAALSTLALALFFFVRRRG